MPTQRSPHAVSPARIVSPANLTLAALVLLGFGVALFADHIASYHLLQWAPSLKRYPSPQEREAVAEALALDRACHATMWLALAGSLFAWRKASALGAVAVPASEGWAWATRGVALYIVLRVLVEAELRIHTVRVPNVAIGIDWHGPGFAIGGLALLLAARIMAAGSRHGVRPVAAPDSAR